jgi:hypothetical protein
MGKPSIFSNDYEQRMKRRRINLILFILVIISASFFGAQYYLKQHNTSLIKMIWPEKSFNSKSKSNNKENIAVKNNNTAPQPSEVKQNTQQPTPQQNNVIQSYEYKAVDGTIYKIEYSVINGNNQIISLKENSNLAFYNISSDKSKIVFEDKSSGHIILGDNQGKFIKISRDNYTTKSTGKTLTREAIVKANSWFVWSVKPYFTSDNRIAYVSHLPYIKKDGNFYIWTVNIDGSGHRKIGQLGKDLNSISYNGYDANGRLIIKDGSKLYYINKGGYALSTK